MMNTSIQRLAALREVMREEHLAACVFPGTTPHGDGCRSSYWEPVGWLSDSDVRGARAVVTPSQAALWPSAPCDPATAQRLRESGWQVREEAADVPAVAGWLAETVAGDASTEVALDGSCCPAAWVEELMVALRRRGGLTLRTNFDPVSRIWRERPPLPHSSLALSEAEDGAVRARVSLVRRALRQQHADGMLVADLRDIAWVLSPCGLDREGQSPFVAYLLIASDRATLFVYPSVLPPAVITYLNREGVRVGDYVSVRQGLRDYFEYNILLDPDEVSYTQMSQVDKKRVLRLKSPIPSICD